MIWYSCTYSICFALKYILQDTRCYGLPNSVSGHYTFHVFYILSTLYLIVRTKRKSQQFQNYLSLAFLLRIIYQRNKLKLGTRVLVFLLVLLIVSSTFTLFRTLALGYHTPRQIYYGILLSVLSHLCLTLALECGCYLMALLTILMLTTGTLVYVFAGNPFSSFEMLFIFLLYLLALFSFRLKLNGKLHDEHLI